jgi:pilus assembly protein Flp/PilA
MKKILKKLLGDKAGASAAEYALILAVVGGGIVVAMASLGENIGLAITGASDDIASGL